MKQLNLEKYNDFELVYLAKEQHEIAYEILQKKYEPIIVNLAKNFNQFYNKIGLDIYDYIIEGRIALDKAINNFDDSYQNIFYTHAINYIRYYLCLLVKNSKKDICLNNSITFIEKYDYEINDNIIDTLEIRDIIRKALSKLSFMERKILILKIKGYSYDDIAEKMQINRKKIDNMLLKIRKKIKEVRRE